MSIILPVVTALVGGGANFWYQASQKIIHTGQFQVTKADYPLQGYGEKIIATRKEYVFHWTNNIGESGENTGVVNNETIKSVNQAVKKYGYQEIALEARALELIENGQNSGFVKSVKKIPINMRSVLITAAIGLGAGLLYEAVNWYKAKTASEKTPTH